LIEDVTGARRGRFGAGITPHLNFPGRMLTFNVQGWREGESGVEPDEVASAIEEGLRELYVE
jgi:hypothetical protein